MATEDLVSTAARLLQGESLTVENCLDVTFELMNAAEKFASMDGASKKEMVIEALIRCAGLKDDEKVVEMIRDLVPLAIDAHHKTQFIQRRVRKWCC
jgi:DNA-directed RNA polymerase subunit F